MKYLIRIATYDVRGGLNAFTMINPMVLDEAQASDDRRAAGFPSRPLEGIPYTLKDSYKYAGLTVTNGSPALEGLKSSEDSYVASRFREAGAILIGKTNMPPMAAGGMQRGLYARAESPYNSEYLTAAFSSGSSNGAGTSTAASLAVFGMASETVSSGRSPASNNALVAYTPSRGIISCRGLWPLYVTCDDVVPYARSVKDMLEILNVIAEPDPVTLGDFWRDQPYVKLPLGPKIDYVRLTEGTSLVGKRIAVPKLYIGEKDAHPNAKPTKVSPAVVELWKEACADLEELGATVIPTDFPLVTKYEDDSMSGEANNVAGAPAWWNSYERGALIAKAWDNFLIANKDDRISDLTMVDSHLLFPKPEGYIPDIFVEHKNLINYPGLPALAREYQDTSIYELPGMELALKSLEAQRKRDFEDWLDENNLDFVVFAAVGDVGKADLEFNVESARHALQNGVKYSNGNRAIRHLGVPTVSVPMGLMSDTKMPVNLTFAGKAYMDEQLLQYAYAYEQKTRKRTIPPLSPELPTDKISQNSVSAVAEAGKRQAVLDASVKKSAEGGKITIMISGSITGNPGASTIQIYLDGKPAPAIQVKDGSWNAKEHYEPHGNIKLSYLLTPMPASPVMVLVVALCDSAPSVAKLLWV